MTYGSETRSFLVDVGLKFESRDGDDYVDVWYLHEGQMKNWEGGLELSLPKLLLQVVDWDGMDMWWGLGEERYGV